MQHEPKTFVREGGLGRSRSVKGWGVRGLAEEVFEFWRVPRGVVRGNWGD